MIIGSFPLMTPPASNSGACEYQIYYNLVALSSSVPLAASINVLEPSFPAPVKKARIFPLSAAMGLSAFIMDRIPSGKGGRLSRLHGAPRGGRGYKEGHGNPWKRFRRSAGRPPLSRIISDFELARRAANAAHIPDPRLQRVFPGPERPSP